MTRNGFRSKPQSNKSDLLQQLSTEVENTSMAVRLSQMMIKQLLSNNQAMQTDLSQTVSQLNELQYKFIAIQRALNLNSSELETIANDQRLKDFEEAAARADEQDQLMSADTVTEDSTIVITSTTEGGEDKGIFRSRVKLSETGVPDLIAGLTGKQVGDKVSVQLNGINHQVELLSIRVPTVPQVLHTQNATTNTTSVNAN